jgi:hypothetical protein
MRTLCVARLAFLKLAGVKFNPSVAVRATASDVVWYWFWLFRHIFILKQRNSNAPCLPNGRGALQDATSQIRVAAIYFIRRALLAAIGAKFILWIALNSSPIFARRFD